MTMTAEFRSSRSDFFAAAGTPTDAVDLSVTIGGVRFANPVMPASGCFGPELGRLIPVEELGAVVTKTVFAEPRGGNPAHRLTELAAGMVNSVGIPSEGPAGYLRRLHPRYEELGVPVVISVGGHRTPEYADIIRELDGAGTAYELNVSCPNLDSEGTDIGSDPSAIESAVGAARAATTKPLIVKLPAMMSSVADCARAAEAAGADAICVSNSIPVLAIDPRTRRPAIGNTIGGLTGPNIRPIVSRLVWLSARSVAIPVVACGGIQTAEDALDYLSLGAAAVQIGTANFARPWVMVEIARRLSVLSPKLGAHVSEPRGKK
ncbi:dihydroorotate dehydrogenase [Leifsonia poae]|uniref:dihydroorotate dehydrogenase n=1 Tax=Leifsonia poae TaxID=110933 RepID=UPI001CC0AAE2|nr:dihydroorotate dehydrogenase [Leifsonia poae]